MQVKAVTHFVIISSLAVSACSMLPNNKPAVPKTTTERNLAAFDSIVIIGPIDVITDQQINSTMHVSGNLNSVGNINATVEGKTLLLRSLASMPLQQAPATIVHINTGVIKKIVYNGSGTFTARNLNTSSLELTVNSGRSINLSGHHIGLRKLTVFGATPVTIKGIDSPLLDVDANHAADITLEGTAGLRKLDYSGSGRFKMQWIKSPQVNVRSHHGRIMLAGIVDSIDAVLSNDAQLDARYLRAKNAYINTADKARADIWAKRSFNGFASGYSNIYYYQKPRLLTKYMRQQGAVLEAQEALPCKKARCDLGED